MRYINIFINVAEIFRKAIYFIFINISIIFPNGKLLKIF